MRLIDADALKEALEENRWYHTLPNGDLGEGANSKTTVPVYLADDVYRLIDNAPAVEPKYFPPREDCNKKMEEIRQAYDKMKAMERPQGEWIIVKDERYGDNVKCPFCEKELAGTDLNYCCKCGAKLIGSEKMNGGQKHEQ